ncbi:hypothetical protein BJ138DRAFT_1018765, partial [Hygrophoropsis aurantiaca]
MSHQNLTRVLNCLEENHLSVVDLIHQITQSSHPNHKSARDILEKDAAEICTYLYQHPPARSSVFSWALRVVKIGLADEDDINADSDEPVSAEAIRVGDASGSRPTKRRRQAAARNMALTMIKSVVCISILLQNTNERCNYLQGILGIFLHSMCVPEKVIEVLAHSGLSISITSIHNAVNLMSKEISQKIRDGVRSLRTAFAYDNFDIDFKTAEPTIEHRGSFVSATSATSIPLFGVDDSTILKCSAQLWAADPRNPAPSAVVADEMDEFDLLRHHMADTYSKRKDGERLSPRLAAFAWHIRAILIHHGQYFANDSDRLGEPVPIFKIPVHKTEQIPFRSMKIKQSTTDGNIEVMENLLKQGGIGEPSGEEFDAGNDVDMSEHVLLVHGDLLTKERLDSVRESRRIEDTAKNRFQYIIFVLGLFHYKMACADAL